MKPTLPPRTLTQWIKAFVLAGFLALSPQVFAIDAINTTFFGNLAIEGYDPVAYFTQSKAVKGNSKYEHNWMNATWRFSSQEHLELFQANPQQYAPQYGGYCAYAVSQNDTAGIDPNQFTIHNGKLFLNYNRSINKKWLADRDQYIKDADINWPRLLAN